MKTLTGLLLVICVLLLVGCGPAAAPAASTAVSGAPNRAGPAATVVVTSVVTSAPLPTAGATRAPTAGPAGRGAGGTGLPDVPYAQERMIVKNGEVDLLVADTDTALAGLTQLSVDYGGYLLSTRSWYEGGYKLAQVTLAVPSDRYESALDRVRRLGSEVLRESSSGQDVTDEYVDLDSRLRNLQTQADRLRALMAEAKNVQEAITVSQSLTDVESQIEQIKGRMNTLQARSAFSTLTVNVQPPRPTPTPTLTPTPTATPTPTPTPTPVVWSPLHTAQRASETSVSLLQGVADALITSAIILGPFLVPAALIVFLARRRAARAAH